MVLLQQSLKHRYIWVEQTAPFTPGDNTIAYYQFDGNLNDSSGNGRNLSLSTGTVNYGTESGGAKYGYFNSSTYTNNYTSMPFSTVAYTINLWYKRINYLSTGGIIVDFHTGGSYFPRITVGNSSIAYILNRGSLSASTGIWNNLCVSITNGAATCYLNGGSQLSTSTPTYSGTLSYFRVNTAGYADTYSYHTGDGNISELIIENKAWSASEVLTYYNNSKSLYGIS